MSENQQNDKKFVSLRLKTSLLYGLLLFIVCLSFPAFTYWHEHKEFRALRSEESQQDLQRFLNIVKSKRNNLHQLTEILVTPIINNQSNYSKTLITSLKAYRTEFQKNGEVLSIAYVDDDNNSKIVWGDIVIPQAVTDKAEQSTIPISVIQCPSKCLLFEVIPLLKESAYQGAIIYVSDFQNTLLRYRKNTGIDIAILKKTSSWSKDNPRNIEAWKLMQAYSSAGKQGIEQINHVANNLAVETLLAETDVTWSANFKKDLRLYRLTHSPNHYLVMVSDVSGQLNAIKTSILQSLMLAVLIAVLTVLVVFLSFSGPMGRLLDMTTSFPLLSARRYSEVKKLVRQHPEQGGADELSGLETALNQLVDNLEQQDDIVKDRAELINVRNREIQSERDFIKGLLDTAQLIIMTLDENFNISLMNDHGEKLTGYKDTELLNTPAVRLFPPGIWAETEVMFNELINGNIHIAQQDGEFINKAGEVRLVSWLHSHLQPHIESDRAEAVILSVGLDVTDKKQAEQRILWMAEHDPLTDLFNRRKFTMDFEKILQSSIRYGHDSSLLFLDLDQFKDINDTSGHKAGDDLLKKVAEKLKSITRINDLVARLGGDEFAIIMPETNEAGAITLAKKVCQAMTSIELSLNDVRHKISASIGIVHFPLHDATVKELMSYADLAMYKAKADGKGTWHCFSLDDKSQEQLQTRVYWKQQIETALEEGNFLLHFQPILELKTNRVTHYEALIRMKDGVGGLNLPGTFIEVAEEVGLIHNIDHHVLQTGIKKLSALHETGCKVTFSLNLSGRVIDDPVLLPMLKHLLETTNCPPENIIFELTETSAVADIAQARKLMLDIKELGCRFSLDDFGVGFSSFTYMRELPVDIIKIDGLFIKDLANNSDDQLFVKALVDVAKGMGKKIIAEFVESREILVLLRSYGVDYAQGYYIGKPRPDLLENEDWEPES